MTASALPVRDPEAGDGAVELLGGVAWPTKAELRRRVGGAWGAMSERQRVDLAGKLWAIRVAEAVCALVGRGQRDRALAELLPIIGKRRGAPVSISTLRSWRRKCGVFGLSGLIDGRGRRPKSAARARTADLLDLLERIGRGQSLTAAHRAVARRARAEGVWFPSLSTARQMLRRRGTDAVEAG